MADPCSERDVLHGKPIPSCYAKVQVDEVHANFADLQLEIPGGDEVMKLGDAVHHFIAWR